MWKLKDNIVLLLTFSIIYGCGPLFGEKVSIEVPDISKKWTDTVKVNIPKNEYVYKLVIELEGEASSDFILNGKEFKSGKVDTNLKDGDYYGTDYILVYQPLGQKVEGNLVVDLIFYYN